MNDWPVVTLGEVCSKPQYGAVAAGSDQPVGPRLVRQTDLVDGRIDWSKVPCCDLDASEYPKYALETDDLIVARLGSVGRAARVREPMGAVYAGYLVRFRANLDEALPAFLAYQLQSPDWWRYVNSVRSGAVQPTLNAKQMAAYSFALPPLPEQRAIAHVLGALDDKIEANRRVARLCSSLGSAAFAAAEKVEVRISDVADVLMGQSPPGSTYNEDWNGLPFYQGIRDFGFRSPALRVWCSAPSRIAEPGDVLVSVRAPVGVLNVAAQRCAIGRGVASVRSSVYPALLYQALAADSGKWEPFQGEGTVFGSIGGEQLRGLRVEWPVDSDSARLEAVLGPLDSRLRAAEDESQRLSNLRNALLSKLLSGELRVRAAETLVGEAV